MDEPQPAIINDNISVKIYTDSSQKVPEIFIGDPHIGNGSFMDLNQAKWLYNWLDSAVKWIEKNHP